MRTQHLLALAFAAALSALSTLAQTPATATLKDTFKDAFYVGVAVNSSQITGADPRATR